MPDVNQQAAVSGASAVLLKSTSTVSAGPGDEIGMHTCPSPGSPRGPSASTSAALDYLKRVFERSQLDDRHSDVQLLSFEAVPTRVFPTWSMAFVGNSAAGREMFGHYAQTTGFDVAARFVDALEAALAA